MQRLGTMSWNLARVDHRARQARLGRLAIFRTTPRAATSSDSSVAACAPRARRFARARLLMQRLPLRAAARIAVRLSSLASGALPGGPRPPTTPRCAFWPSRRARSPSHPTRSALRGCCSARRRRYSDARLRRGRDPEFLFPQHRWATPVGGCRRERRRRATPSVLACGPRRLSSTRRRRDLDLDTLAVLGFCSSGRCAAGGVARSLFRRQGVRPALRRSALAATAT